MSKQEISQEMLRKIWIECEGEIVEMLQKKMEEALEKEKKFEVELPEIEDLIGKYYLDIEGDVTYISRADLEEGIITEVEYQNAYINGLIFNTKEEAERYDKERLLLFKIEKWAEIHNEDWKADVENGKYYISYDWYDGENKRLITNVTYFSKHFSKLPYFKTEVIAQACIDEFGDEILEVLVNE